MNTDDPQHPPPWAQRRRGAGRTLCCLCLAALCLGWVGFFAITGQLVPFWGHTHHESKSSAAVPTPEPMHQVNLQAVLGRRDAVHPGPPYPQRVPNPRRERINEQVYKDGELVPFERRKKKKNKIVILPIPFGPHVIPLPSPFKPATRTYDRDLVSGFIQVDLPMAFIKPSSPSVTPPSSTALSAPGAEEAAKSSRVKSSQRIQQAVWNWAVARWAKEEKSETARMVENKNLDDRFTKDLEIWNQYRNWFYEEANDRNFIYKRDFMRAVIQRYQLWVPGTYLPEQCHPIMETKYTEWDNKKEFPCIVAIARQHKYNMVEKRPTKWTWKSSKVDAPIPFILPVSRVGGYDYLSCEFRINTGGNIEIRCPGLFSTDGKRFEPSAPQQPAASSVPSVTYKSSAPVAPSAVSPPYRYYSPGSGPVGNTVSVKTIDNDSLPTPSKASTTRLPPLHLPNHGVGPYVPNISPSSPSTAARSPACRGPVAQPTPTPNSAS
ncbi:Putative protein of unknown function [Podospora comata]|uniref:Uncharacterized protein n=1 Tax=Podospora comata TaxID=48703 RepID=A0ABY6S828_PODCO|nr:Putative protein of unknown function [Podospora comata]